MFQVKEVMVACMTLTLMMLYRLYNVTCGPVTCYQHEKFRLNLPYYLFPLYISVTLSSTVYLQALHVSFKTIEANKLLTKNSSETHLLGNLASCRAKSTVAKICHELTNPNAQ